MKLNRKDLLALVALIVLSIFAAALVAAQSSPSASDTDDDGEEESLASPSAAALSQDEAVAIAEEYAGSTVTFVELENEGGTPIYSVELEDGSEVEVEGNTGDILEVERPGADGD